MAPSALTLRSEMQFGGVVEADRSVRRRKDEAAAVQMLAHQSGELGLAGSVEGRGRLVEQPDRAGDGTETRDRQAAPLSGGQISGRQIGERIERRRAPAHRPGRYLRRDTVTRSQDSRAPSARVSPGPGGRGSAPARPRSASAAATFELDSPGRDAEQTGDHAQERRFSRPVRPAQQESPRRSRQIGRSRRKPPGRSGCRRVAPPSAASRSSPTPVSRDNLPWNLPVKIIALRPALGSRSIHAAELWQIAANDPISASSDRGPLRFQVLGPAGTLPSPGSLIPQRPGFRSADGSGPSP